MEGSSFLVAGGEALFFSMPLLGALFFRIHALLVLEDAAFFFIKAEEVLAVLLFACCEAFFLAVMLFADFEATARFFPAEEAFLAALVLETFFVILFAETARFIPAEEAFLVTLLWEDIFFARGIFFPLITREEPDFFAFAFKETFLVLVKALPFPFLFSYSLWKLLFLFLTSPF